MAREIGRLRAKQVDKLLRAGTPGVYSDGLGLRLEIRGPGVASWVARYEINGVERHMGLGSARVLDLAEARLRNRTMVRQRLLDGIDPLLVKRADKAAQQAAAAKAVTFADVCRRFLEQHAGKWASPKHAQQWANTLAAYAEPVIGRLPVADIDVPLILKTLEQPVAAARGHPAGPLWQARPETAARLRNRIEAVLDWAKGRGYRSGDNPAALAIIGMVLPARSERQHHPALPYKDIPAFMQRLRARPGSAERALEFLILCASRTQEVLQATWSEFDFDAPGGPVWNVPPEHMKMRKPHRVPLSDAAVALLRALPRTDEADGFVFVGSVTADGASAPLNHTSLQRVLKRMNEPVTVHGMRASFRDFAGEATSIAHDVAEAALAHTRGDKSVQAYARGDLFTRRRELMTMWANFSAAPPVEAEIVPIGSAR